MNNANYMDAVPVKIAEKYKPPPPIYKLSQPLSNKLNLEGNFYWNCPVFSYDFHLEKKALSKIEQWKHIRQREKELRRDRILKREELRKREDEDRQKNLLNCVSYPSTDDLSSEEDEKIELSIEYIENKRGVSAPKETTAERSSEKTNSFLNILQPTVLSFNSSSTVNTPLTEMAKSLLDNKLSNSFNYKDFEEDTSSPFDNIELKTINDLDVLAQVLHNSQIKCATNENVAVISSNNINENPQAIYLDGKDEKEFDVNSLKAAENIPKPNNSLPRFTKDFHLPQGAVAHLRDNQLISNSSVCCKDNIPPSSSSPINQHYESNNWNGFYNYQSILSTNKIVSINSQIYGKENVLSNDQITKSKSVPDIIKELRDEIRKSEIRRHRNCSYNTEDLVEDNDVNLTNESSTVQTIDAAYKDTFSQLDSKAKQLVEQISAMGFPLERVARIVQLIGTDDKKVVEHLIPLSELADFGFEEGKISDALIRNENNKNKALDDLIS